MRDTDERHYWGGPWDVSIVNDEIQVIEVGDGIRFRPKADPSSGQCLIAYIEDDGVIIKHLHLAPVHHHFEAMPLANMDCLFVVRHKFSDAALDAIDSDVLLKRIDPGEVVVSIIQGMPYETAASHTLEHISKSSGICFR